MSNAWLHLPNAHHIDWVLESLKENPKLWSTARDAVRVATWEAALNSLNAAWDATQNAARSTAWDAAWDAALGAGLAWAVAEARAPFAAPTPMDPAWDAIRALIAWDDCDQFIDMPSDKLKTWAILSEDPRAILLFPMIYVKERLNDQCMVTST